MGRIEGLHGGDTAGLLFLVVQHMGATERQEIQGLAPGMEIHHIVGQRQQGAIEIIRDLLRQRARRTARKRSVHVPTVNRRGALARLKGGIVHAGHDDHPSGKLLRLELAGEVKEGNRPLVLVPVIGPGEQDGWPLAVFGDRDWDGNGTPGRRIVRVRQLEEPVLDTIGLKINRWSDGIAVGHKRSPDCCLGFEH